MGFAHSQVGIGTRAPAGKNPDSPDSLAIDHPQGILHLQGQHYYAEDSTGVITRNLGLVVPRVQIDAKVDTLDSLNTNQAHIIRTPTGDIAVRGTMVFDSIQQCLRVKTADGVDGWNGKLAGCLVTLSRDSVTAITELYEGMPIHVKKVSAGYDYTLLIDGVDGMLYSAGVNSNGRTGLGTASGRTTTFKMLLARTIVDMSAGYYHGLAADSDGKVWAWGEGSYNRTGQATTTDFTFPKRIQQGAIPTKAKAVRVEAGYYNSLVLCDDGKVYAFGGYANGMLGSTYAANQSAPVLVNINTGTYDGTTNTKPVGIKDIALSQYSAAAIDSLGKVYIWGNASSGRLGNGVTSGTFPPTQILSAYKIKQIALGDSHGVALSEDNKLYGWGNSIGWGLPSSTVASPIEITSQLPENASTGINGVAKSDIFVPATDTIRYIATDRFSGSTYGTIVITNKTVYGAGTTSGLLGLGTVQRSGAAPAPKYSPATLVSLPFRGFYPIYRGTMKPEMKFVQASIGGRHSVIAEGTSKVRDPQTGGLIDQYGMGYGTGAVSNNQLGAVNVTYSTIYIYTFLKK